MNKVRIFLSSIVLTALTLSINLHAGISPLAFNGIFNCFKKPEFAPNLGCAALQTGLVNNIRFCMVNPGKKDAHGNRLWIEDKAPAHDPVAALALLLFPSPAGTLSVMTSHKNNIGRYLVVEHIAQLLNFCAHVRAMFLSYEAQRKEIAEKITFNRKNNSSELVTAQDLLGGFQFGKNGLECLNRLKKAAKSAHDQKNYTYFLNFEKTHKQENGFLNEVQGRQIISELCKSIEHEERRYRYNNQSDHFYPKYITEQLLNAFFCLKFGKDDIPTLLAHLDDSIVDKDLMVEQRILDKTDFEKSNQKDASTLTLDDLWILQNRNTIGQVIPFEVNSHPIDYALASGYNRAQKQYVKLEFTDCMETVFRLFCSLMFYSKELSSFDLSLLKDHLKDSPILKNFEEFFQLQTPDQVNSGSRVIRDACNKLTGDLGRPIRYNQKSSYDKESNDNELSGGIINFIRTLALAFDIENDSEPIFKEYNQFIAETTKWAISFLQKIYALFNPQKNVIIKIFDVSCFQTRNISEYDCGGTINIVVDQDFKFTITISGGHAQFDSIKILEPVNYPLAPNTLFAIKERFVPLLQNTIGESLFLLDSKTQCAITQPIYKLFQRDLRNSSHIIQALKQLYSLVKISQVPIQHAALILQNCLQNFEWKNYRMVNHIQPTLKKWLKFIQKSESKVLSKVLQEEVQAIQYKEFNDAFTNVDDLLNYFCGASILFLEGGSEKTFVTTQNHPSVKKIDFTDCDAEKVIISGDNFPNLEILDLSNTESLQSLRLLGPLNNLTKISFEFSSISKIKISSENCPNLENLEANNTDELETMTLSGSFKKLNTIDLSSSAITKLEMCGDNFPTLQRVDLGNTKSLKKLGLIGSFASIKKINLDSSGVTQLKLASNYPKLEILDLKNTESLEDLELSGSFNSLKQILLSSSAISLLELAGNNFPKLKDIELEWINNLNRLELSGNFEQLSEIYLANSSITEVVISESCPNLKTEDSRITFVSP